MTKRMLIDATHAEETRVVVLDGTRLEDFDVETSTKRQLKGNIYLAKVVRVEPSLQAAFVEYGGNRHGFLAFSEIHPDYYQIPVADRQRLIEMQAEDARREQEEDDLELALGQATQGQDTPIPESERALPEPGASEPAVPAESWASPATPWLIASHTNADPQPVAATAEAESWASPEMPPLVAAPVALALAIEPERVSELDPGQDDTGPDEPNTDEPNADQIEPSLPPETVGGGDLESGDDQRERRLPPRFLRNYKIQEVIRRRQILLVQVVKEERGTKGAALTTYLSLAGRFGVLMPNSPRGGGISRKITSAADRRRLKEVMAELDIPRGMGMIVRTAGANRPKPEIKRDCEYLLRLWDDIREHTMKSVAPAVIYEEASLIKRAIRDVYSRDIDEILVDGEDGWRAAHDFMRMLMPTHAKKVQLWRDGGQPLFARNQVEAQLDGMLMPTVQLRSGGYLVINQAEALVAIDVNSGRSTRERNVEETALRTNLEAADEVARQLRLRDLAGLVVIDFIDMESKRHNAMVERRIKEALKNDRARIQIGHISHFGLLEMSRQRLRPSLAETSFIPCPHCGGTGHVRSTENAAIHVLRGIEDEGGKRRAAEIVVHVSTPVALYLLNHKRDRLREIEMRYAMQVIVAADDAQIAPQFRIEKVRMRTRDDMPAEVSAGAPVGVTVAMTAERAVSSPDLVEAEQEDDEEEEEADAVGSEDEQDDTGKAGHPASDAASGDVDEAERPHKRRRRRRGGRRDEPRPVAIAQSSDEQAEDGQVTQTGPTSFGPDERPEPSEPAGEKPSEAGEIAAADESPETASATDDGKTASATDDDPRNRRRGRRGGRRRRRENENEMPPAAIPGADQPELPAAYAGPTPADPFGGRAFDIFDIMDQAELAAETNPPARMPSAAEIVNTIAPEPDAAASNPEPIAEAAGEPALPASEPRAFGPIATDVEITNRAAPEPAGEPTPDPAEHDASAPLVPANDTAAGMAHPEPPHTEPEPVEPLVRPIVIGAGTEPPVERKRGWWQR